MQLAAVTACFETPFAFSHRTAGALLGLDGIPEDHVEIITMGTARLSGVTAHRISGAWPRTTRIDGFPVTSAQRTVLDTFAVVSPERASLAMEDALRRRLTSIDRLWNEYVRTCDRGRNGCRSFRGALLQRDHRDGKLQSRMEARLRRIIDHIPENAVPQHEVITKQGRYVIDFAFPDIKLGIEAHSIRWHMGQTRFYYDLRRDRALKRCGWTLIYFSWDDLLRPEDVINEIIDFRASHQRVLF